MVIDFEKIAEAHLEGFKGGQGKLDTRNYVDDKVKIMYSTLRPGASTGLHTHEGNCEIIYVVSGTATSVSYTHLTLPTKHRACRSRWSPYH